MTIKFNAGEVITAMVTPFTKDGNVDYDKAGELASYLIDNGTDSILVAGGFDNNLHIIIKKNSTW